MSGLVCNRLLQANSRLVSDKFRALLRRAHFAPHPGR